MTNKKSDKKLKRNRKSASQEKILIKSPTQDSPAIRVYQSNPKADTENVKQILTEVELQRNIPAEQIANTIIHGDSLNVLKKISDNSIPLIITSPPYWNTVDYGYEGQYGQVEYTEYIRQLLLIWTECERILIPNGKLAIISPLLPVPKSVISNQHTRHLKNISADIEYSILNHLNLLRYSLFIWQKQTTEKMFGSYPYPPNLYEQNTIEFINVFVKPGKPRKIPLYVKIQSSLTPKIWMNLTRQIWTLYPKDVRRNTHPAPFPGSIPNRLIAMYSFAQAGEGNTVFNGDIILDPFCGTGTTCIEAVKLARRFIGIDLSQDFCIMAQKNIGNTKSTREVFLI